MKSSILIVILFSCQSSSNNLEKKFQKEMDGASLQSCLNMYSDIVLGGYCTNLV